MDKRYELGILLDYYGMFLTQRQRNALEQSVCEDFSLSEIAEREGISRQGVSDAIRHGTAILYEMEEKAGIIARNKALLDKISELSYLLEREEKSDKYFKILAEMTKLIEGNDGV